MSRFDKCFSDVKKLLRQADVDSEVVDEIDSIYQRIKKNSHLSSDEQVKRFHTATQEWRQRLFEERITKVKQEEKTVELWDWLGQFKTTREKISAFRNFIEQDGLYKPTTRQSVSKKIEGLTSFYLHGQLKPVWDALATQGLTIRETPLVLDVHREMLGIDTGNRAAKQHTKAIREVTEPFLSRLEGAGS